MEPPKKDNVIDIVNRLKERAKTERPIIKELMESDFEQFRASVAYAIDNLYENVFALLNLHENRGNLLRKMSNSFWNHGHPGLLTQPEKLHFDFPPGPQQGEEEEPT